MQLLLRLKSNLLAEAFKEYLLKKALERGLTLSIDTEPLANRCYDIIIFEKHTLKESSPEDFPNSKKLLLDDGGLYQESLFLFLYYKLSGILSVDITTELFFKSLEVILKGELWLSKKFLKILCEDYETFTKSEIPKLSERESAIVKMVCEGYTNKEIAYKLRVSEQTIKSHLNRIFKKTNLKSRTQLIKVFYGYYLKDEANREKKEEQKVCFANNRVLKIKRNF